MVWSSFPFDDVAFALVLVADDVLVDVDLVGDVEHLEHLPRRPGHHVLLRVHVEAVAVVEEEEAVAVAVEEEVEVAAVVEAGSVAAAAAAAGRRAKTIRIRNCL
uniref:Uncharacterized protein n=1 Tax=Oryza barthii TaxID=65489 RepID=A0A0D3FW47_9ORYZ